MSQSSTKAEYKNITTKVQELEWIKSLASELDLGVQLPIVVHCDNLGVIYLVSNVAYDLKTKHVTINLHFIRESVEDKSFRIQLPENQQQANILTKPL